MALKFGVRRHLDVTIVDLKGWLSLGEESRSFRELIRELVWEGHKKIVLENSALSYTDSSGLGELVSAFTTIHNRGGELVLAGLTKRVSDMLQITKLYTVYPVFRDVDEALKYFDEKRPLEVKVLRRWYGDVLVLEITGKLAPENGCAAVEEAIRDGKRNVVCLCNQVIDASAEGCAMLVRAAGALRERQGGLVLAETEPRLEEALRPCVNAGIRRFETLDEALAEFGVTIDPNDRMKQA